MLTISETTTTSATLETIRGSADLRLSQTGDGTAMRIHEHLDAAVINEVSSNTVPLDLASYAAILGSVQQPGDSLSDVAPWFQRVIADIGDTLSKGQGGYYIALNIRGGGGFKLSMTPQELADYMQHGGPRGEVSITTGGHTYTLYNMLKKAFAASARFEALAAADPAMDDPRLRVAEALLDHMRGDSTSTADLARMRSAGQDASRKIQSLVLSMDADDGGNIGGAQLTIVYFPPGVGSFTKSVSEARATVDTTETLSLTA